MLTIHDKKYFIEKTGIQKISLKVIDKCSRKRDANIKNIEEQSKRDCGVKFAEINTNCTSTIT